MASKQDVETRVILGGRNYSVSMALFRHTVGESLGLNVADIECFGALFYQGASTPTELAQLTGLSPAATSAMINRLEKSGLVERHSNPNDRRGTLISIAKKKGSRAASLFAPANKAQRDLLARYSQKELELITDFLERSTIVWEGVRQKIKKSK